MKDLVTIVTAFVDIGRGEWEGFKNGELIPPYIKRDTETYFQRFERLTKLDNPIIVFTESKNFERILSMRDDIQLIGIDSVFEDHQHLLDNIRKIQQDDRFIDFVTRPSAPEYWSPEYVAINFMKSHLVDYAVSQGMVNTRVAAWIDFGYVRDDTFCPPGLKWTFDTEGKINIFNVDNDLTSRPIFDIVRTGDVFVQGCHIVAPSNRWQNLKQMMNDSMAAILAMGLIDDDQTLLLMSYRSGQDYFKVNPVSPSDWFVIFKNFQHD